MSITQYGTKPFQVFTIDGLFMDSDITDMRSYVLDALKQPIKNFTCSDFENGKVVDKKCSTMMYERIRPFLPAIYDDGWQYIGAADAVMFARICEGKHFGIHTDTGYMHDPKNNVFSKFTVLIYLNDDFEGGTTSFYSPDFEKLFSITPKTGRVLCFDIDEFHKGDVVTKGTKMWIGTELVCAKI
jgi:prolyl 4-hydroxylase